MSLWHDLAYGAAAVAAGPVLAWRLWRTGKYRTDWPARFGHTAPIPHDRPTVLIHAVSLGEVNAVRLLVERLHESTAGRVRIVIASTTNTGTARAREIFADTHAVVRYPFDFTRSVRRFLDAVQPDVVALTELEVWPNFVAQAVRRGAQVCVINGRISDRSIGTYRAVRPLLRSSFAALSAVAAQDRTYADRFVELGAPAERVQVTGTMKWDTVQLVDHMDGADRLAAELGLDRGRPIVVLGSTGEDEEAPLVSALRSGLPDGSQIVIVPRKPERFEEVARLFAGIVRRSNPSAEKRGTDLFLLDTLGELRAAYALADVAVVGRSFNGWGGSDPIEPVALGRPTIIGPAYQNFASVVQSLCEGRGLVVAADAADAARTTRQWIAQPQAARQLAQAGRRVILSHQGATDRHARLILDLLPQPPA